MELVASSKRRSRWKEQVSSAAVPVVQAHRRQRDS